VRPLLVLAFLLTLAGCTSGTGPTYYRDTQALIVEKCGACHVEGGVAPFALLTYEQVQAQAVAMRADIASGIMPPWPPGASCAPLADQRSLTAEERALLLRWLDSGAPAGDIADARPVQPPAAVGPSRVDLSPGLAQPYTPVVTPDEYRCFVLDWTPTTVKYITGFAARPGNAAIVHHVLAFVAGPSSVASYQALDAADPAPGYTCFGGPGGDTTSLVGGWAPGAFGGDYPAGTGLKIFPGSKIVLQIHYHVHNHEAGATDVVPAPDQTSLELKLDDAVEREAVTMPWADPTWVTSQTMDIPAGVADVVHAFTFDPSPYLSQLTGGVLASQAPYVIHAAALHQHLRGTRSHLEIRHSNGSADCLLDIPRWDFRWQGAYRLAAPVTAGPGDLLSITCHWDNSAATQPVENGVQEPPRDLNWGEGTDDEMCVGFLYVTR